jgi:hypothetical protein
MSALTCDDAVNIDIEVRTGKDIQVNKKLSSKNAAEDASISSNNTDLSKPTNDMVRAKRSINIDEYSEGLLTICQFCCYDLSTSHIDLSKSVLNFSVTLKPGNWKYCSESLVFDDRLRKYSSLNKLSDSQNEETNSSKYQASVEIKPSSSLILALHGQEFENPAIMLGYVVLPVSSMVKAPEIEDNVYLIERDISSSAPASAEASVRTSGKMWIKLKIELK